jgi:hypothetical protein
VAELAQLGQTVKQRTQQLQPLFHDLAERVSDVSKTVLNRTWTAEMGSGSGSSMRDGKRQPAFDLGPPPIASKNGASSARQPWLHVLLLVRGLVGMSSLC